MDGFLVFLLLRFEESETYRWSMKRLQLFSDATMIYLNSMICMDSSLRSNLMNEKYSH